MNLPTLRQEAREEFEHCDEGPMGVRCNGCSTALTVTDTLITRIVDVVEKEVTDNFDPESDMGGRLKNMFRNFRGI